MSKEGIVELKSVITYQIVLCYTVFMSCHTIDRIRLQCGFFDRNKLNHLLSKENVNDIYTWVWIGQY